MPSFIRFIRLKQLWKIHIAHFHFPNFFLREQHIFTVGNGRYNVRNIIFCRITLKELLKKLPDNASCILDDLKGPAVIQPFIIADNRQSKAVYGTEPQAFRALFPKNFQITPAKITGSGFTESQC
ncbi:hypothetical protein SDC9_192307 [bioreactor metagenome]|uniref:Uncharacterized protein n=1 Tax=bioreactor metagenome TaxID=1076179 RepID=A0A645I1X5_9ZZZZ